MNHLQHSREIEQASFLLILAVVTIMLAVIVWPFATSLLWSALAAIMFQPLYKWSLKKMRGRRNPAALLSLTIIFFAVLVPALWLGSMVVNEMLQVVDQFRRNPIDLSATFEMVYDMLPAIAQDAIDDSGWTDLSAAQERIQEFFGESAGLIASQAVSIGGGALNFVFAFTLGLYVTFFLLRDGSRIGETVLSSVPVERSIADRLADRFLGIVRATIKGSVVVGIVQGTLGAITFAIVGLPSVVLFGVLMAILSLVPVVGTVLVWGPAGVYLLVTGSVWQGLFVLGS
ncbi:MAG: AI-2E family transporter, partial [Pseudomonadota bacterium]